MIALLVAALLFGGMVLYSFGFAAFLLSALPAADAGPLLRKAFPHFYLFVLVTAGVAALLASAQEDVSALLLAVIAVTTLPARQVLMPAINDATDSGATGRFKILHGFSVLVTLAHIALAAIALVRLAAGSGNA